MDNIRLINSTAKTFISFLSLSDAIHFVKHFWEIVGDNQYYRFRITKNNKTVVICRNGKIDILEKEE